MINYTFNTKERAKTQIRYKIIIKYKVFMSKRTYIHPSVVNATMENLVRFDREHKGSNTPLIDAEKEFATNPETREYDRARLLCAARRLGWNVHKTRGHVYENGFFAW